MKRWQVVIAYQSFFGLTAACERVHGEYRWRWVANVTAFMWNTSPGFLVHSVATVRRKPVKLEVVK